MTIEDVILTADRRGMRGLRPFLPHDFCTRAAWALHGASARVLVVSGFHVEQRCETDGPPGALALVRAIRALGGTAILVGDGHSAHVMSQLDTARLVGLSAWLEEEDAQDRVTIDFPVTDRAASDSLAQLFVARWQPTAVVAVERCGATADGTYRNMRGEDISDVTAHLDGLFSTGLTIGVGDGGNEIGMGSLAEHCIEKNVTRWPSVTSVLFPVISTVSNWGAYGICAALSQHAKRDLMPSDADLEATLENIIKLDGLDGVTRTAATTVDGHSLEDNLALLRQLRSIATAP